MQNSKRDQKVIGGDESVQQVLSKKWAHLRLEAFVNDFKKEQRASRISIGKSGYRLNKTARGQTMMEYIIIVALLAVASIAVTGILGNVFRDRAMKSADAIVGKTGNYQDQGRDLVESGKDKVRRGMDNFDQ